MLVDGDAAGSHISQNSVNGAANESRSAGEQNRLHRCSL
jgi:hypothetical protein